MHEPNEPDGQFPRKHDKLVEAHASTSGWRSQLKSKLRPGLATAIAVVVLLISLLFVVGLLSWPSLGGLSWLDALSVHLPRTSFVLIGAAAAQFLVFNKLAKPSGFRGLCSRLGLLVGGLGILISFVLLINLNWDPGVLQTNFEIDGDVIHVKLITLLSIIAFLGATVRVCFCQQPLVLPRTIRRVSIVLLVAAASLVGLLLQLVLLNTVDSNDISYLLLNRALDFTLAAYLLISMVEVFLGDFRALIAAGQKTITRIRIALFAGLHAAVLLSGIVVGFLLVVTGRDLATLPGSTIIKDSGGQVLQVTSITTEGHNYRLKVSLGRDSEFLEQAVVAIEDRSFFSARHRPVDPIRLASSMLGSTEQLASDGSINRLEGGSTITQQVVKMHTQRPISSLIIPLAEALPDLLGRPIYLGAVFLDKSVIEMPAACVVELFWSKEEIVSYYLNSVYLGENCYGMETASWEYFGKPLTQLSRGEATLLAGLPQAPSQLDPRVDLASARKRQALVIDALERTGYLTPSEAQKIAAESIELTESSWLHNFSAPHFSLIVTEQASRLVGQRAGSGGVVNTTLDKSMQDLANRMVKNGVAQFVSKKANNGALVVMDSATGSVRALVGSAKNWSDPVDGQYDMAIAERPAASTFKLFVYVAAYEHGFTPESMIQDIQRVVAGQRIVNWDGLDMGSISLRDAFAHSRNPPAVELTDKLGVQTVSEVAHRMGITSNLHEGELGPIIGLGACNARMLDLATAYAAIANDGVKQEPVFILGIQDWKGNVIYEHKPAPGNRVVDKNIARAIDSSLRIMPYDDGFKTNFGAKTGTTDNFTDAWVAGYGPGLTVVTWMGNTGEGEGLRPMDGVWGYDGAGSIWRGFMASYYHDNPKSSVTNAAR